MLLNMLENQIWLKYVISARFRDLFNLFVTVVNVGFFVIDGYCSVIGTTFFYYKRQIVMCAAFKKQRYPF